MLARLAQAFVQSKDPCNLIDCHRLQEAFSRICRRNLASSAVRHKRTSICLQAAR
jgi:hypothetical protein